MKKIAVTFAIITSSIVASHNASSWVAPSTVDESFCLQKSKKERLKNIGSSVFGAVGGLLGSKSKKNKKIATAIGISAGTFLNAALIKQLDECDQKLVAEANKQALDTGEQQYWRNSETGKSGTVAVEEISYPQAKKQSQKSKKNIEKCLTTTNEITGSTGEVVTQTIVTCKGSDGVWRPKV